MAFVERGVGSSMLGGPQPGLPAARGEDAVPVARLLLGRQLRDGGVLEAHVERLMDDVSSWAPIVVSRQDLTVIDGRHRVVAARRLGLSSLPVTYFDGDPGEAFVEFLRSNAAGGLPLSKRERHRAVRRVLHLHPDWADRRIGTLCDISSKTVAEIRQRLASTFPSAGVDGVAVRVGRDGRARPVDPSAQRARVAVALQRMPGASLRAVAQSVGASPETVRSVRASLRQQDAKPTETADMSERLAAVLARSRPSVSWRGDAAFSSREDAETTAAFMERTDVASADVVTCVSSVPLSRIYEVADEARRRAVFWSQLAERVERRAKRSDR